MCWSRCVPCRSRATIIRSYNPGSTVLLSTHDPQHALRFSRRVLALQGGRVAAEGDTRSVLTPDLIRQLYGVESVLLDTPDGAALLPVRGGDRHV